MSDPRVLLCVDLSYQVYRACAAHPHLSSRGTYTGGLYGFFTTLAKMIRETKATSVVFCEDVKPYKRSELYPEYKQIRKQNADDDLKDKFRESFPIVTNVLKQLGLPVWGIKGFESDDLIGYVACRYRHRYEEIYAGSNDSDLFQLFAVCDRFFVYRQSMADTMSKARLLKQTGLTPEQFMLASALMGTHNDVEGIHGVGKVTAAKAVKDPQLMRQLREKHSAIIERNLKLIKLPHAAFPQSTRLPTTTARFDARLLYRLLGRYDMDTTASIERAFEQVMPL